jgi:hypothetical protein
MGNGLLVIGVVFTTKFWSFVMIDIADFSWIWDRNYGEVAGDLD